MIDKNCLGKHSSSIIRENERKLRKGKSKLNTRNIILMRVYIVKLLSKVLLISAALLLIKSSGWQ